MSFNLFGPTEKRDIKVGYISTDRGYVKGISLYEANKYAFKNPGTTFILETRDSTRYLNINDVNNLTVEDIIPKKNAAEGTCPGVVGLNPQVSPNETIGTGGPGNTIDPRSVLPRGPLGPIAPEEPVDNGTTSSQPTGSQNTQTNVPDGSPLVVISGCGGVGAKAIPVIGNDGGILDIVVTSGGFGYKCPPQVTVIDPNRVGSGVVATSTIGVTTSPSLLTYTDEDDFEVYNFDPANGSPDLPGYGNRVNPDGENVGEWDPTLFATFAKDPIALEIAKYQKFLKQLKNPWWTTRRETPLNVSFGDRRSKVTHNVTHPAWEKEFMNKYAISPVPPSNVKGSDFAGRWCTFEWEENFPHAGEYIFRGMADNIGKMYLDNEIIMEVTDFKGSSKVVKKTVEEGVHRIKVDLLNVPIREKPKTELKSGGCPTEIDFKITTDAQFANGIKIPGLDIDFSKKYDGKQLNESFRRKVELGKEYDVICTSNRKGGGREDYSIEYDFADAKSFGLRVRDNGRKIQYDDDASNGFDKNGELKIMSSSPGVNAKFSDDGKKLLVKGSGDVTIRYEWDDKPNVSGVVFKSLTLGGKTWRQEGREGQVTKTIKVESSVRESKPNIRLRTSGANVLQMEEHTDKDWQDLVCTVSCGRFIKINGNKCKLIFDAPPPPQPPSNQSQSNTTVFNTTDFIKKADRKLWRTNLYNTNSFLNEYGICPFNTITKKNEDYDGTHIIRWEHVTFPADGNYNIEVEVDDSVKLFIGNRSGNGAMKIGNGLKSVEDGGDEVIIDKKGFVGDSNKSTGKSTYSRFFKKGQYRIRAELYQKPGGVFGFSGRKSYGKSDGSDLTARFEGSGDNIFLVMKGTGSATVNFSLDMSDTLSSGYSLGSIKIGDVQLKRSKGDGNARYKSREIITGSGTFLGGERYKVVRSGANANAPDPTVNRDTIQYFDGGSDSRDGTLKIVKLKDRQGAPNKGLNPMALAIRITSDVEEVMRISPKTWNENPMGAAFTIEAPLPPIPVSPRTFSEGRCPENPTWTTRFPGGEKKWWPVTHKFADGSKSWSKFMNRFAISPIPPLGTINTDGGGIVYSNSWQINIPHSGFYALKGTVDNGGRILIDDVERMRGGYFPGAVFSAPSDVPQGKLAGFGNPSPPLHKFYLEEGQHKITVEVENQKTLKQKTVEKKIFSTKDWRKSGDPDAGLVDVNFKVTSDAQFANSIIFADEFSFSKKYDGPQINETTTKKLEAGKVYNVRFKSNSKHDGKTKDYSIIYEDLNPSNESIRVVKNGKKIELKDGKGNDANVEFEILAPSPGVTAKFSNDGRELIVNGDGDVPIRIKYDDNPGYAGEAVRSISIAGTTWRKERTEYGEEIKTIKVKSGDGGKRANVKLRTAGETVVQMEDFKDNDYTDIIISASKGKFYDLNGDRCKFIVGAPIKDIKRVQDGVSYNGPPLFVIKSGSAVKVWSKYMQTSAVSPLIPPIDKENPAILGEKTYTWSDVDFFESGRYKFLFQSDDDAILYINGSKILESKSFRGEPIPSFAEISKGKYEVKVVCNNITLPKNILIGNNPTGFALKIVKDVVISETSFPWTTNPVGISAILIPPPCPKVVDGKGIVVDIDVKSPGNGFPSISQGGVPTVVTIKTIEPTLPGINYDPDDKAIINDIPVPIEVDNFGRVTSIKPSAPIIVTDTPVIEIPSLTGVGFRGTPIMQTTIVPELVFDDADIIQVTDLVGLKQNGYVNGKPYYGSVFSKNGELFAGIVETTGVLVPVYATLQESIDQRVTTRPSAILRQGTDSGSNNPRLNIPGTPENLI